MALAADITSTKLPSTGHSLPASLTTQWQTLITDGGPAALDAATITNPETQITAATSARFVRLGAGSHILLRLRYDDGLTSITAPVVKVFGRTGSQPWQLLKNRAGNLSIALTPAATDTEDGTYKYTTADFDLHAFDCLGCDEILVGIETALAGTGTTSNSAIEIKVI